MKVLDCFDTKTVLEVYMMHNGGNHNTIISSLLPPCLLKVAGYSRFEKVKPWGNKAKNTDGTEAH